MYAEVYISLLDLAVKIYQYTTELRDQSKKLSSNEKGITAINCYSPLFIACLRHNAVTVLASTIIHQFILDSDQASSIEGCVIENALTGIVINSRQVQIVNCRVVNSILYSVEIGPQSDTVIDFGDSLLERSLDKGILVERRATGITLRNVRIADSAGVGLDFDAPSEDITINNVKVLIFHHLFNTVLG
jgi:hypothetical protein